MPNENLVSKFQEIFAGSELSHAIFIPSGAKNEKGKVLGAYTTLHHPATTEDYLRHLEGEVGLVIVPARANGTTTWGAFDVDPKNYVAEDIGEYVSELRKRVVKLRLPLVYFPTKSGGLRFVLFLDSALPLVEVRALLAAWRDRLGLDPKTEIFPKQDSVSESNKGNSVNLPFFADAAGFESWVAAYQPVNIAAWLAKQTEIDAASAHLGGAYSDHNAVGSAPTSKGLKIKKATVFQEELDKVGLKYELQTSADGTKFYNYHGIERQPCLIKGQLHENDAANKRQARFVEKDGCISHNCFSTTCQGSTEEAKVRVALRALGIESRVLYVTDGSDWREFVKSKGQLDQNPPEYLVDKLLPAKALTFITAPSYHCKTWFALQMSDAVSRGAELWWFKGPKKPVPVIYHVPEMNEAFVHQYMDKIGIADSEDFLVRPMELGLWKLNDPRMLKSCEGRLAIFDTAGYFNPTDDTNAYNQALKFAELIYGVINAGAVACVGLYHIPKYARDEVSWTLETSVIGSAGYGGILRSCIRTQNVNPDLNDPNVWLYVQGLKNPGLKPFQLHNLPLEKKVGPGDSPYLKDVLSAVKNEAPEKLRARQLFAQGLGVRETQRKLEDEGFKERVSLGAVSKMWNAWKQEAEEEQKEMELAPNTNF